MQFRVEKFIFQRHHSLYLERVSFSHLFLGLKRPRSRSSGGCRSLKGVASCSSFLVLRSCSLVNFFCPAHFFERATPSSFLRWACISTFSRNFHFNGNPSQLTNLRKAPPLSLFRRHLVERFLLCGQRSLPNFVWHRKAWIRISSPPQTTTTCSGSAKISFFSDEVADHFFSFVQGLLDSLRDLLAFASERFAIFYQNCIQMFGTTTCLGSTAWTSR